MRDPSYGQGHDRELHSLFCHPRASGETHRNRNPTRRALSYGSHRRIASSSEYLLQAHTFGRFRKILEGAAVGLRDRPCDCFLHAAEIAQNDTHHTSMRYDCDQPTVWLAEQIIHLLHHSCFKRFEGLSLWRSGVGEGFEPLLGESGVEHFDLFPCETFPRAEVDFAQSLARGQGNGEGVSKGCCRIGCTLQIAGENG